MGAFILRKAGAALIVVFLASVLVFVGVRAIPGDPALAYAAEDRDPKVLDLVQIEVQACGETSGSGTQDRQERTLSR